MKKCLFLYIPVLISFAQRTFAQLRINNPLVQKEARMPFPDKLVIPASTRIVPAHIPGIKRPFVVTLDNAREFINKSKKECPALKNPAPTIILNAQRTNNFIANLEWETKYALKASGFNIERSLADTFHFETVNFARLKTGTSLKKNYHLRDYNDYSGVSFYRIKQLDHDTTYRYSNIASVKGYDAVSFRIYPNPAAIRICIEFITKLNGKAAMTLYDASGKIMQQQILNCTKGSLALQSLDISKFPTGVYQVKILMPDETFLTGKFIKE